MKDIDGHFCQVATEIHVFYFYWIEGLGVYQDVLFLTNSIFIGQTGSVYTKMSYF